MSEVDVDVAQPTSMTFYKIRDPKRMFEDSWGDIDEMWEALEEKMALEEEKTTEGVSGYECLCSPGRVDWTINAGIRY